MRRGLALLAALCLILALPAAASAGKATRITDTTVSLYCDGISTTGGSGLAFFGAFLSTSFGPDAYFDYWSGGSPDGPSDVSRDYAEPVDISWDGTTIAGSFPIVDSAGTGIGEASFSATLTPVGDPYTIDDSFKDGNQKYRASGSGQALQPEGTLSTTTGLTFDLGVCMGDVSTVSTFATNPASFVAHYAQRTSECPLTSTAGDPGFLYIDFGSDDAFVDSAVFPAAGGTSIEAIGNGAIVGGALDLNLDTYDWDTGEQLNVPAAIHATFVETNDKFVVDMHNTDNRQISRGTLVDIEGTLTIGDAVFDLSPCVGANARTKYMFVPKQGPKPGGKAPSNDTPTGAILLAPGKSTTVQTKGAALDREAPYECLTFEEEDGSLFEVPVENTVWYKVYGTGGSITFDTTGTDFDTVAQVYTSSPGGFQFVPDGCVDDVPLQPFGRSLQASVTFPTVAGTEYYVQIGGYPEAFPYGILKVAVR